VNLFGLLELSGSALRAERQRAEIVAANMANAETTRTPEGGPYRRQLAVFHALRMRPSFPLTLASLGNESPSSPARGVALQQVISDSRPPLTRYQPGHPDADREGFVAYPAVSPVEEMTDLLGAARAYELNAAAVQAAKQMITQSLDLLR